MECKLVSSNLNQKDWRGELGLDDEFCVFCSGRELGEIRPWHKHVFFYSVIFYFSLSFFLTVDVHYSHRPVPDDVWSA